LNNYNIFISIYFIPRHVDGRKKRLITIFFDGFIRLSLIYFFSLSKNHIQQTYLCNLPKQFN